MKQTKIVLPFEIIIEPRETCPNFIDVLKQKVLNTYKNKSYHIFFVQDIDIENATISYGQQDNPGLWCFTILAEATVLQYNIGDEIEISLQIKSKDEENVIFYGTHEHFDCNIQTDNLSELIYFTDDYDNSIQFKINNETRRLKNNEKILVILNEILPSCLQTGFGYYLRATVKIL